MLTPKKNSTGWAADLSNPVKEDSFFAKYSETISKMYELQVYPGNEIEKKLLKTKNIVPQAKGVNSEDTAAYFIKV